MYKYMKALINLFVLIIVLIQYVDGQIKIPVKPVTGTTAKPTTTQKPSSIIKIPVKPVTVTTKKPISIIKIPVVPVAVTTAKPTTKPPSIIKIVTITTTTSTTPKSVFQPMPREYLRSLIIPPRPSNYSTVEMSTTTSTNSMTALPTKTTTIKTTSEPESPTTEPNPTAQANIDEYRKTESITELANASTFTARPAMAIPASNSQNTTAASDKHNRNKEKTNKSKSDRKTERKKKRKQKHKKEEKQKKKKNESGDQNKIKQKSKKNSKSMLRTILDQLRVYFKLAN